MASYSRIIGLTSEKHVIKTDANRKSISIFNTHATATIYIKEGSSVGILNGIPIYPFGNIGLNIREDGKAVQEPWSIISDTALTRVIIFEGQ
ncbi:unnamed protein product [marine sediment metagenome]|uniref:Uncharacterized protein n=1 Tax=marine sediment metagenome TaxID=412755 RepID=X0Z7S9_9ZZZZ